MVEEMGYVSVLHLLLTARCKFVVCDSMWMLDLALTLTPGARFCYRK